MTTVRKSLANEVSTSYTHVVFAQFSKAAKVYEKRLNRVSDASRCLELMGDYAKALDLLCSTGLHTKALDVVDRFNRFQQEQAKKGGALPGHIKPPGYILTLFP